MTCDDSVRWAVGDDLSDEHAAELSAKLHQPLEYKSDFELAREQRIGEITQRLKN